MTIFIVVFVFVVALIGFTSQQPLKELQSETVTLATAVTRDPSFAFIKQGKVDKEKFAELAEMNYTELQRKIGVKNDFCIFIEDAEGNLIPVQFNGKNFSGIGNGSNIEIGGKKCGK
jgi:hypothetical protein